MSKLSGNYTIRIADKNPLTGPADGSVVTVEVTTYTADEATTIADVVGKALDKLGLSVALVGDSPTNS
jgi:hypothetical protein